MRRFLYIDVYQLSVLSSAFFPCSINGWHFLSSLREVISLRIPWVTRAGLPNIRFQDLRHSAATLLLSLGIHPKVVQELLGHIQISMTIKQKRFKPLLS